MEVYSWENLRPEWWICQLATFDDTGELCIVPQVDAQRWASNPGDFLLWTIVTYAQQCEIQTSPCPEIQDNSSRLIFQNHVWCFTGVLLNIYTVYIYYYIIYILHIIFSSCFNPQNQTTEPSSWDVRSPFAKWSHRAWGGHSWDPRLSTGSLGSWYFNACVLNDSMLKTSEDMWM